MYPERATCVRRLCIGIKVVRPGYMFPGDMCPGVNAALYTYEHTYSHTDGRTELVVAISPTSPTGGGIIIFIQSSSYNN